MALKSGQQMRLEQRKLLGYALASMLVCSCGGGGGSNDQPLVTATKSSFLSGDGQVWATSLSPESEVEFESTGTILPAENLRAQARKIYARSLDGEKGQVKTGAVDSTVFAAPTGIFRLDAETSTTTLLSALGEACRVGGLIYDFNDKAKSIIVLGLSGQDKTCNTSDDGGISLIFADQQNQTQLEFEDGAGAYSAYSEDGTLSALLFADLGGDVLRLVRVDPTLESSQTIDVPLDAAPSSLRRFQRLLALSPGKRLLGFNRTDINQDVYVEYDEVSREARVLFQVSGVDRSSESVIQIDSVVAGTEDVLYVASERRLLKVFPKEGGRVEQVAFVGAGRRIARVTKVGDFLSVIAANASEGSIELYRLSLEGDGDEALELRASVEGTISSIISQSTKYVLINVLDAMGVQTAVAFDPEAGEIREYEDARWLGSTAFNQPFGNPLPSGNIKDIADSGLFIKRSQEAHSLLSALSNPATSRLRTLSNGAGFPLSDPIDVGGQVLQGRQDSFGSPTLLELSIKNEQGGTKQGVFWIDLRDPVRILPVGGDNIARSFLMLDQLR